MLHIAGHFLSAFCVYKIIMSTVNIVLHRVGRKDPVTRAFEIIVYGLSLSSSALLSLFCVIYFIHISLCKL